MKKWIDLFAVPGLNLSVLYFFNTIPFLTELRTLLEILVLIATLVFTIMKIKKLKNTKAKDE